MEYINQFKSECNIAEHTNLESVEVAVNSIYECKEIVLRFLYTLRPTDEKSAFVINTHINLLDRIFKHAKGMLSCVATNNMSSSEALGRVVVEGSINLMYMASFGEEKTILGFFKAWIMEHKRKLNEWNESIDAKKSEDIQWKKVKYMCIERQDLLEDIEQYMDILLNSFSLEADHIEKTWPKSLYKRFEELQKEESYFTTYHRLSGASHITAEDTISWHVSTQVPKEARILIFNEARSYSILMSRITSIFFIDATIMVGEINGLSGESINFLQQMKAALSKAAEEISKDAGVPQ